MLRKVLVANRGEIACRVIRACEKLGIASVAVYSDADADAAHVHMASESVRVGPSRSVESYLNIPNLLEAARRSGADAVHPGYGFLSENEDFASAVLGEGLVWVGPSPQCIRSMGDKQRARELAMNAGVPVAPGSTRLDAYDEPLIQSEAARIGYPLLIKASAGGGGIGMRRVSNQSELKGAFNATHSLAKAAFGNGEVFLEKLIVDARHVEVQVFGFGVNAVHLYERDCSVQRRFQKVIEEAPAPGIDDGVRARLQASAVALTAAVDYHGAGTVEFVLDANTHAFYFLEMNTRIQVEHPVTEMITGNDLVAMQLRHAGGELDTMRQEDISRHGHAIECRIYAENPARNFLPSPGKITEFELPESQADAIRVETGYTSNSEISIYYDPLIAKVIAWADDRERARQKMIAELERTRISGPHTNVDFLINCLKHPDYRDERVTTRFIGDNQADLCKGGSS